MVSLTPHRADLQKWAYIPHAVPKDHMMVRSSHLRLAAQRPIPSSEVGGQSFFTTHAPHVIQVHRYYAVLPSLLPRVAMLGPGEERMEDVGPC
jgi:hypothetical protein